MSLLPRLQEVFEFFAPAAWAGVIGVVVLDVVLNRRDTLVERVEDYVFEPWPQKPREDPLDGIHP